jgi:hypothetical protein
MKMAILLAALHGWAACAGAMLILAFTLEPGLLQRLVGPNALGVLHRISIYALWSGAVSMPAGLLGGSLVSYLVPPASPFWKPGAAAAFGGMCGVWSIGMIFPIFGRGLTLDDLTSATFLLPAGFAALNGIVCGYSLARSRMKKFESPMSTLAP